MKLRKTISPYLLIILFTLSASHDAASQRWKKSKPNTLYARNKGKAVAPILVGIGTKSPTALFHTIGTVRLEGLTGNETANRFVMMDPDGNLYWRDASGSSGGNGWLINGNTATVANFLGTINNEDLRIRTSNIQRAVITNAGSLGLGITTPTAQLHTNGTVRFEGLANSNTAQRIAIFDNSGNLFYRDLSSLPSNYWGLTGNNGTNPANNFLGTTDNNRLVFRTNNTEKMTILANGNVGIGLSNPIAPLHVFSTTDDNQLFLSGFAPSIRYFQGPDWNASPFHARIGMATGNANYVATSQPGDFIVQALDNGSLILGTNGANANGLERMRINSVGNVGIATTNPTARFHTNGTVRHENLPTGTGNILVVDANGNVFKSTTTARPAVGEDITNLKKEMDQLKKEIAELKSILSSMKGGSINIGVNDENAILFQNTPNPFSNTTTIRYYLPANSAKSSLEINDLQGKLLKTFQLAGEGRQSVSVNANEFAAGTYVYTLIVNNKRTDSKKMVLTQ